MRSPIATSLSYVIMILIVAEAHAQQQSVSDSIRQLKEVVISYKADRLTPVTFFNLKGADLKVRSTGQEPSFLLSETPSVTVYSDAGSTQGYSYFRMRGIDQTRINISLDGVPLNEPEDQGAYFSNYPDVLNSVSQVQVQRGVGTSKNGVASYGGSVQLFSPNLYDSARINLGGGYGSFNSMRAFGELNSGIRSGKGLYARVSQIYSDGYKYNSSNSSRSVFLSHGVFRKRSEWKLNVLVGHQQNQLAWLGVSDSLISINRRTNANKNERDNFTQSMFQFHNIQKIDNASQLHSCVYYTFLVGNYDFNLNAFLGRLSTADTVYNYAFKSSLVGFFSNHVWKSKRFTLTTGVHGNMYSRNHKGTQNKNSIAPHLDLYSNTGYKNEMSVFNKANYSIRGFTLFSDIQYRVSTFSYHGTVPLKNMMWTFFNPKIGVTYEPGSRSQLYYSIGRTGREPTRNDMFGGSDDLLSNQDGSAMISINNPEYVVDQELGYRLDREALHVNFNLYYMSFKNEIVLDGKFGPNGLALTNNVDKSIRSGAEASLTVPINQHFTSLTNASYNYSKITEQHTTFKPVLSPPAQLFEEVVYTSGRLMLGTSFRYQARSYIDFSNTNNLKDYVVMNARAHYTVHHVQLSLFFYNLLNTRYVNNGYVDTDGTKKYFAQAPTNYYISIRYNL